MYINTLHVVKEHKTVQRIPPVAPIALVYIHFVQIRRHNEMANWLYTRLLLTSL